ncbi:insecticidal delta-endotoxin Cry8Ea1 family protein [Methanosarcina sp. T3]|uniref:insecticidal delta-endotoxin Cry8Ea1 family protein n=1 Tax=Methanosarcina sp. T3 TaxID=3439062 RepID=UPI003F82ADDD
MTENQIVLETLVRKDAPEYTLYSTQADYDFDYNNAARVVVSTALGEIPGVGFALSALVEIFWPDSQEDVWSEIKDQVEALIDEKISDLVYQQVQEDLEGLKNNLDEYLWAVQNSQTQTYISEKYNVALVDFLQQLPHFQSQGYELLLLPLFTQFANMHLTLLRDGALYGSSWGWTEEIQQHTREQIVDTIGSYIEYTEKTYSDGLQDTQKNAPSNKHYTEPFNTVNRYVREMTLDVLDFKDMWQYFDPVKYPTPAAVYLSREIYSDAVGTADNSGAIKLPSAPREPISKVEVWAWDRIDACQVTYPNGGGPGGVTQTARMGDKSGGSSNPPHGGVFNLSGENPIVKITARTGDILNAWWFTFKDGSVSNELGGNYSGGSDHVFTYPDEILSSIKIMGVSSYYGSADCAVSGFKFDGESTLLDQAVLQKMYIASPSALKPEELAGYVGFKNSEEAIEKIRIWIKDYNWDEIRERRWTNISQNIMARRT